jgi:hypothetical protein
VLTMMVIGVIVYSTVLIGVIGAMVGLQIEVGGLPVNIGGVQVSICGVGTVTTSSIIVGGRIEIGTVLGTLTTVVVWVIVYEIGVVPGTITTVVL